MKIALVSSVGGHLTDLVAMLPAFDGHDIFWVVNDPSPVLPVGARAYVVAHAERDWRVVKNVAEFAAVFARERPDVVVSTGAGPAVPAAIVARIIGARFLYVEASCAVTQLSLTGRLVRPLADTFFVQWRGLAEKHPWARYVGGVL